MNQKRIEKMLELMDSAWYEAYNIDGKQSENDREWLMDKISEITVYLTECREGMA